MRDTKEIEKSLKKLQKENENLRMRLSEAEKKLKAIHGTGQNIGRRKSAEEASLQNEKLLKSVLDNVSSGVAMIDGEGRFTVYNSLFLKLFGLSEDSTIKNVNDQNWAEWQVFDESGNIQDVDEHPVRKAALTGKRVENQLVGVKLPSGGQITWMLISAEPINGGNGEIEKIICSYHDITERKLAEEALKNALGFFNSALSNMTFAALLINDDERIDVANQAFCDMFNLRETPKDLKGITSGEMIEKIRYSYLNPDEDIAHILEIVNRGILVQEEEVLMQGERIFLRDFIPLKFGNNRYGRLWIHKDITAKKVSEQNLQYILQRFYLMLSSMYSGVLLMTDEGKIEFINQAFCKAYGLKETPGKLVGMTSSDLLEKIKLTFQNPEEAATRIQEILKFDQAVKGEEFIMQGDRIAIRDYIPLVVNGKSSGRIWIHTDVTELKRIGEVSAFQARLLSEVHDAVFSSDSNYMITYWNQAAERMFGWTKEEVLGKNSGELLKPKLAGSTREKERSKLINTGHWEGEVQYIRKDGTYFFVEVNSSIMKDANGNDIGKVIVSRDITERRQTEEALRISEEKFSKAFKYSPNAITITRISDGKIIEGNESVFNVLGYNQSDVVGKTTYELEIWADPADRQKLTRGLKSEGFIQNQEFALKRKDGKHVIVDLSASIIMVDDQKCFLCSFIDITERKKTAEKLFENERRLSDIYKSMSEGLALHEIIYDNSGKAIDYLITEVNPAFENITGLKWHSNMKKMASEFYSTEEAPYLDIYSQVVSTGRPTTFETYFPPLGKHFSVSVFSPAKDKFATVFHDITEQKLAEEAIKKSEALYRAIGETIDYGIWICDANGKNIYASESYLKLVGITQEQCSEFGWGDTLHPDDREKTLSAWKECSRTGGIWDIEHRFKGVDGKWHPILARGIPIRDDKEEIIMWAGINLDISKIKETENALRESEERERSILINSLNIIYRTNLLTGEYEFLSPSVETILGYSQDELMALDPASSLAMIHPEDIGILRGAQAQSNKTGNGIAEYRQMTKSGEYRWLSNHMSTVKNSTDLPIYRDGNIRDITEQRKAENELKEAREKLNMALENANVGLWEWDITSNKFILDERMEKMFGLTPGAFGNTYAEFESLINEEDIPHFLKAIKRSLDNQFQFETIFRIKTENGREKFFSTRALSNKDKKGNTLGFTGVCFDITGMKEETDQMLLKLSKELLRSNKELQQFAYVASHDLQEPLRMISSFTQLLAHKYGDKLDEDAIEYINFAVDGAKRMHNLINALLSYSRIQTRGKEFSRLDTNLILETVLDNLSIRIKDTKAIITFDELPDISGDEGQITQLLQNLIGNALKFNKNVPEIHISSKRSNGNCIFSIKDNGIGIEEQYFERIFIIFQRLDCDGEYEGTGIGLAICKSIVERHGGRIWVESEFGKGLLFTLRLKTNNLHTP